MTMLGRGERSKKTEGKSDEADEVGKSDESGKGGKAADRAAKAAKAEEAAQALRLAEEAAAKAREAVRLAQQAAEAAAEEAEDGEEPAKSLQKPEAPEKAPEGDPAPEDGAEEASAPDTATEDSDAEDAKSDDEADDDEDAKPAKTKRLTIKKSAADDDEDEDDEPRRARLGGLATVIGVLAVLAIALGSGTTALALTVKDQAATEQAAREASFASSRAAQKLSSYDYRTLDADLKAAEATTTGKLRDDYGKLAQNLKTVAVRQQAISNTTIVKIGVVSSTPDKVVTLVYANRASATKNDKQPRLPEPLRIKMTMVKKGEGKWLASQLKVI